MLLTEESVKIGKETIVTACHREGPGEDIKKVSAAGSFL